MSDITITVSTQAELYAALQNATGGETILLAAGNYGDIAALPKTPNVGFGATGPGNTAAATAGGSVYNVTMNVTGSNAEEISNKVLAKIKLMDSKMNKTNRIPL